MSSIADVLRWDILVTSKLLLEEKTSVSYAVFTPFIY